MLSNPPINVYVHKLVSIISKTQYTETNKPTALAGQGTNITPNVVKYKSQGCQRGTQFLRAHVRTVTEHERLIETLNTTNIERGKKCFHKCWSGYFVVIIYHNVL